MKEVKNQQNQKHFYTVGIGTSAGGLNALELFFKHLTNASNLCFIVIQHLDRSRKSILAELLAKKVKIPVQEIEHGLKSSANCIYVLPSNKQLKIKNGVFHLKDIGNTKLSGGIIDSFFKSLATDQKEKSIGILLSGMGHDGTIGLKEIKKMGGMSIVQDPETAQFDDMPDNAIVSKLADHILKPEKMSAHLLQYMSYRNLNLFNLLSEKNLPTANELSVIFQIIRRHTAYDFSNYKSNTIIRRLVKRMAINQIDSIDAYIELLKTDVGEIEKLYNDFLIGVTNFFRDQDVFHNLENKIIPELVTQTSDKQNLRIWVCGCSTGEEAYSLAILLNEALAKNSRQINVTIFASDIDYQAIKFARNATYKENALAQIDAKRLKLFFIRKEEGYQLKKEIREMVVFSHHNVIKDPPFSKMDMISCRNLLIYLNSNLQKKIIPMFHYSLNNHGILLLGKSESIGDYEDLYTKQDSKLKIYKKTIPLDKTTKHSHYIVPFLDNTFSSMSHESTHIKKTSKDISSLSEKTLLEKYAPASLTIDKNNTIIYFSGNNEPYLSFSKGLASLNILTLIKREFKPKLQSTILKARSSNSEIETGKIDIELNNRLELVNIIVKPISSNSEDTGAMMIIFEHSQKFKKEESVTTTKLKKLPKPKITELERELNITREHLQTAISELETSNDHLQTTNEEYQSANEELQSANEELETSREELQSVNEELLTVNTELSRKIELLSQANDDLNNLLSSIEVATIFLDRDLNIKRFNPSATKIFNLIPSDIDRPVTHLSSNISYKNLIKDVNDSLKTLSINTADVKSIEGVWYNMRIVPYRTEDNIIEGVLISFIDISKQKSFEAELNKMNNQLDIITKSRHVIPFTISLETEYKILFVGDLCEKEMGFLPEQFIQKTSFWINRIHPDDRKKMQDEISDIVKNDISDNIFRWKCADGKYKQFSSYMKYIKPDKITQAYIVGFWKEHCKRLTKKSNNELGK